MRLQPAFHRRPKARPNHLLALADYHPDPNAVACRLDRLADFELQAGHHAAAEHLATLAAAARGAA